MAKKKYPEARTKYNEYNSVVTKLKNYKSTIQTNISLSLSTGDIGSDVSGDYYDKFAEKEQEWRDQVDQVVTDFDNFQISLQTCITNAEAKATLWYDRISMTEEE
ncbi:hypothetical protein [Enterococcus sp. BWR-S5]|uniref:hypothetical protein n=1 Tax=Enterococcus sp. BWR-S5 TaxID=2787714 RepID=UPI0019246AF7|nr:hypothetical protein [Enterococcus sp. BWR-S5]MBL1223661.1 hypothetical protein [Enterococcus sp. BWR-S5]